MTTTNRTLNRIILLLLGLVAVIVGVTIGAGVLTPVRDALQPSLTLPDKVTVPAASLWIIAAVCAVVIILALIVVFTRGGGGTSGPPAAIGDEPVVLEVPGLAPITIAPPR